eukprot:6484434-Amphidinium_carterae.1
MACCMAMYATHSTGHCNWLLTLSSALLLPRQLPKANWADSTNSLAALQVVWQRRPCGITIQDSSEANEREFQSSANEQTGRTNNG